MTGPGRLIGMLLLAAAALALGVGGLFLATLLRSDETTASGAALGAGLLVMVVVVPLAGVGLHLLGAARKEAAEEQAVTEQRQLLEMVLAEGQVTFANASLALGVPRSRLEEHVRRLIGLEVFSGAVNWKTGALYSREAALLRADQSCLSCGARLEFAGKGLIACAHCGAETFLLS